MSVPAFLSWFRLGSRTKRVILSPSGAFGFDTPTGFVRSALEMTRAERITYEVRE